MMNENEWTEEIEWQTKKEVRNYFKFKIKVCVFFNSFIIFFFYHTEAFY